MVEGGRKLSAIKNAIVVAAQPGVTTVELDNLADKMINEAGGKASFKMVAGYHHATCLCVNDVVVHGIPGAYKLKQGDILGIDVGLFYKGFHTDTSITIEISSKSEILNSKFLDTGKLALKRAIAQVKVDKRIADISKAMQGVIEEAGYAPVEALTGHGVGRELHEEPAIPCFVFGKYDFSPKIIEGMVLAVEVMYNEGVADVAYKNDDGWTIATADGKISGLFEESVAVTKDGPVILTNTKDE